MPSTLLTLPLLLFCSFVGASSLWRMYSEVSVVKGFCQSRWNALLGYVGVLFVVMLRVVLSLRFVSGISWIPPDLHGFKRWVFDSLEAC